MTRGIGLSHGDWPTDCKLYLELATEMRVASQVSCGVADYREMRRADQSKSGLKFFDNPPDEGD